MASTNRFFQICLISRPTVFIQAKSYTLYVSQNYYRGHTQTYVAQIFGGAQTKMKKSSEIFFLRDSEAHKEKGFPNFSPVAGFFFFFFFVVVVVEALITVKKLLKLQKTVKFSINCHFEKGAYVIEGGGWN